MKDDFVIYIIRMVAKACPSLDEEAALELEDQIRQDLGGQEVYVSKKRLVTQEFREKVAKEYIENENIEDIKKNHGISRASLYRYLKK